MFQMYRDVGVVILVSKEWSGSGSGICVTLCVTLYWNSNPYFPSSHFCFQKPLLCFYHLSIPNSNLDPLICFWNSICLTLPILPVSYLFLIHPNQRFCNSVLDLLIPPCCACNPALLPVVIKEPPMFSRVSSNID